MDMHDSGRITYLSKEQRSTVVVIALAGAIIGVGISWLTFHHSEDKQNRNAATSSNQKIAFSSYYPEKLPQGFTFDRSTTEKRENLVSYTIRYDTGKNLFVSIQPRPAKAVLDKFHNDQMVFSEPAETPLGEAFIGNVRGNMTASIVAKQSWILITAPQGIEVNQLKAVVNSFTSPAE